MLNRVSANDEERQISSVRARRKGLDLVPESPPVVQIPPPESSYPNLKKERSTDTKKKNLQPTQSCFLCLRGKRQTRYAIRIPCYRSKSITEPQRVDGKTGQPKSPSQPPERVGDGHYSPDSKIYEDLVTACYQHHGNWKRWIPFYGIVSVQEVKFLFDATTDVANQFEVYVKPLKYDDIRADCDREISSGPDEATYNNEGQCYKDYHTEYCPPWQRCIEDRLKDARRIKSNLDQLYLLRKCALYPTMADHTRVKTLDGMALGRSPIMDNTTVDHLIKVNDNDSRDELLPGYEFVLGWQTDRIFDEVPSYMVLTWFGLASIWVVVVAGGLVGDWNLWVAVGQLLIASLAVLLIWLK